MVVLRYTNSICCKIRTACMAFQLVSWSEVRKHSNVKIYQSNFGQFRSYFLFDTKVWLQLLSSRHADFVSSSLSRHLLLILIKESQLNENRNSKLSFSSLLLFRFYFKTIVIVKFLNWTFKFQVGWSNNSYSIDQILITNSHVWIECENDL